MKYLCTTLFCLSCLTLVAHDFHHHPTPKQEALDRQIRFFKNRLAKNPEDTISLSRLGQLYLEGARVVGNHDFFQEAANTFSNWLQLEPEAHLAHYGLAASMLGQHQFKDALSHARAAAEKEPQNLAYCALLGDVHLALGHTVEAEFLFLNLVARERSVASLSRLAQVRQIRGDHNRALELYQEAQNIAQDKDADTRTLAWCQTMLAEAYGNIGQSRKERLAYEQALELDPTMVHSAWKLAEWHLQRGQTEQAQSWNHRALKLQPDKPQFLFTQARILGRLGDLKAAHFREKAKKQIETEMAAGDLGHIRLLIEHLLENETDLDQAMSLAQRELEQVRADPTAYELMGWALHLKGRSKEAVPYFEKALRPGTGSARILLRAGMVHQQLGHRIKATWLLNLGMSLSHHPSKTLELAKKTRKHLGNPAAMGKKR